MPSRALSVHGLAILSIKGWRTCSDAFMLTNMSSAATLVKDARASADLSVRALAERARVAGSTVSRIEAGEVDPGIQTVSRLLAACGRELGLVVKPSTAPSIRSLASAWSVGTDGEPRPDWTRLRAFLDYLAFHPDQRGPATVEAPPASGSRLVDNLLAAIAETTSDEAKFSPPRWTTRCPSIADSVDHSGNASDAGGGACEHSTAPCHPQHHSVS